MQAATTSRPSSTRARAASRRSQACLGTRSERCGGRRTKTAGAAPSARDAAAPGRGGLALALARSALAGDLGVDVDLDRCDGIEALPDDVALFSESAGRLVVTVAAEDADAFEQRFDGLPCRRVGVVTEGRRLRLRRGERTIVDTDVERLRAAFRETLEHA